MRDLTWIIVAALGCSGSTEAASPPPSNTAETGPEAGTTPRKCTEDCAARVIASGLGVPDSLAVDGARVFWVEFGTSPRVASVARSGGDVATVAAGDAQALAIDATHVYWISAAGAVLRVGKVGGTPEPVAAGSGAGPLVVDDARVYWTTGDILYAPKTGGGPLGRIKTDGATSLALDATHLYFTSIVGDVFRVDRSGDAPGPPARVLTSRIGGRGIAVDEASVFFVAADDTSPFLARAPKTGGELATLFRLKSEPGGVQTDSTHAYIVSKADGPIAVAKSDGVSALVTTGTIAARSIASDDVYVYVADLDDEGRGRITRVGKK